LCLLSNLSVDERYRLQIANSDILLLLIKFLDDDDMKVNEAAGGVLANLALSDTNHKVMVEAGVIPALVRLFICFVGYRSFFLHSILEWNENSQISFFPSNA